MIFDMAFCLLSIEEQKILLYLYVDKVGNYAKCADDYGISIYNKKIKLESKGAKRELAKLFLNNLYGKMASSTETAAQQNYHGIGKPGFIYADTDSIHCDLLPSDITGITVHDKNFCC